MFCGGGNIVAFQNPSKTFGNAASTRVTETINKVSQ
jgi:hypothetical protein